jgi:hypothetical protein
MTPAHHHSFFDTFDRVIPASVKANSAEWQAARHLTILAAVTALSVPLLTMMYHLLGYDAAGMVVLTAGIVMMTTPFMLNAGLGMAVARDMFVGALYLLKIWMFLHFGGMNAPTTPWFVLCPAVALLLGGLRPGLLWSGLVGVTVFALFLLDRSGAVPPAHAVSDPALLQLVCVIGLLALITIIIALAMGAAGVERRHK